MTPAPLSEEDRRDWLRLSMSENVGPATFRTLLRRFGSAGEAIRAIPELARKGGLGRTPRLYGREQAERDLANAKAIGARFIASCEPDYPPLLRETDGAPPLICIKGDASLLSRSGVAIVGSRNASAIARKFTRQLAREIGGEGHMIISGLARGIDTAAHEAALAAKGRTIAVIGAGIGKLYPPENMALAERIAQNGAVISEYAVDRSADKQTFPYRNRVVAGWSSGLLVTEAPLKSGSLITAQQAVDQGRTVYAVPGPIDKPTSAGCNRLIQQGAKLVMNGDDILDDLTDFFPMAPAASKLEATRPAVALTLEEEILYKAIDQEERHIDELISRSGLTTATVNVTLMRLEMKRLIRALPGRRYLRLI